MAAAAELTPTQYIGHHLSFNARSVGDGAFWTLNVDTLVTSVLLGILGIGFLWWVVRGATAGVPNKRQAFVELAGALNDRAAQDHPGQSRTTVNEADREQSRRGHRDLLSPPPGPTTGEARKKDAPFLLP